MKLLIDLLRWGEGGTQTFAKRVVPRLLEILTGSKLLAHPDVARALALPEELNSRVIGAPPSVANPYRRHFFQRDRVPGILADNEIDVYFVPGELSGLQPETVPRVRVVKMFRNMLPVDDVERRRFSIRFDLPTRIRLELLRYNVLAALERADRVIFTSKYSLEAISRRISVRDHRLVYHAVPDALANLESAGGNSTASERIFLYVSPTDPYKRQLEMIDGFVRYRRMFEDTKARLVLAGPIRGHYGRQTRRAAREAGDSVSLLGPVSHDEILKLMRRADVLLFGSTCECCPNVVLEYLAAHRPILCSGTPPMPEIAGEAAIYFDVLDPDTMAQSLRRIVSDSSVASALTAATVERAERFPLSATIDGIIGALTSW